MFKFLLRWSGMQIVTTLLLGKRLWLISDFEIVGVEYVRDET